MGASRVQLQLGRQRLQEKLNPLRRIRGAVTKHPVRTFGIAAGAAFAVSLLRRRSASRPTSFKRHLFRWGFSLAQPAIRGWLLNQAKERLIQHIQSGRTPSEANTP